VRIIDARVYASGLVYLFVRIYHTVCNPARGVASFGAALSVPTGDAMNLLGSGTPGVQPFAVWSTTFGQVSPHANVSYRWNGDSVLAGNPATGQSGNFPDNVGYAIGAEVSAHPRVTMAFDVIGRYTTSGERLRQEQFAALDGRSIFPNISFAQDSFHSLSGTAGAKAMIADRLLLTGNVLFGLDEHGVRDRVTPMLGLEYSF
jgi:hypothetical protein